MKAAMAAAKGDSSKSGGKPTRLDQIRGGSSRISPLVIPLVILVGTQGGSLKDTLPTRPSHRRRSGMRWEAVTELERAILNVITYRDALQNSPRLELDATINALNGGFTAPSSGGDAVANPQAVPTGRNLYSVRAESTPSQRAWSQGVQLAQSTLKAYKEQHGQVSDQGQLHLLE